jgi:hypothetical protein
MLTVPRLTKGAEVQTRTIPNTALRGRARDPAEPGGKSTHGDRSPRAREVAETSDCRSAASQSACVLPGRRRWKPSRGTRTSDPGVRHHFSSTTSAEVPFPLWRTLCSQRRGHNSGHAAAAHRNCAALGTTFSRSKTTLAVPAFVSVRYTRPSNMLAVKARACGSPPCAFSQLPIACQLSGSEFSRLKPCLSE